MTHGNTTTVWLISRTTSFIGLTFQTAWSTSWVCWCTDASTTKHLGTWGTTARQSLTSFSDSVCVRPADTNFPCHVTILALTAVFCCQSNCLELTARWTWWSGMFCRQFQTVIKDIFVFAVLVCTARQTFTIMRYINLHLTDIWQLCCFNDLTMLLNWGCSLNIFECWKIGRRSC